MLKYGELKIPTDPEVIYHGFTHRIIRMFHNVPGDTRVIVHIFA